MGKKKSVAPAIRKNTYGKGEAAGYLVGLAGQNIIYQLIASGLYFYFQNVICLPAMALSVIMMVARIWDAVNDPMMGSIVDRTRTKWGKCKPYLMFVPALVFITSFIPFLNKSYAAAQTASDKTSMVLIVMWAAVSYILWGMTYTVGDIPLWGVTSLMTDDENDRSKILALARIVANVGVIGMFSVQIAQGVASVFVKKGLSLFEANQKGFIITALVISLVSSLMFEVTGLSVKERVPQSKETYTLKQCFKTMFKNDPFRRILLAGVLRSPMQLLNIIAMTFVTYYFCNGDIMNLFKNGLDIQLALKVVVIAIGIFGGMIIGTAGTNSLARKFQKKTIHNAYCVVSAIPFAAIFVVFKAFGGNILVWPAVILCGILFFVASWCFGGLNVLQSTMIADCIDYEEYTNGVRTDGIFFSGQSFITKLSAGIATGISGIVYQAVGYSGANIDVMNKALAAGADFKTYADGKYAAAMFFLITIPIAIGMILSLFPMLKYPLTDTLHSEILEKLKIRRAEKAAAEGTVSVDAKADSVHEGDEVVLDKEE